MWSLNFTPQTESALNFPGVGATEGGSARMPPSFKPGTDLVMSFLSAVKLRVLPTDAYDNANVPGVGNREVKSGFPLLPSPQSNSVLYSLERLNNTFYR